MITHSELKAAQEIIDNRHKWSKTAVDEAISMVFRDYFTLRNQLLEIQHWADSIPSSITPSRYGLPNV